MKILVTGATGGLGRAVVQTLLKNTAAENIVGLGRNEAKAQYLKDAGVAVHLGDYDNIEVLDQAMQGVDKVLLISGGNAQNGLQQHYNVVDAAKKAGVKCIAYTGRSLRDRNTLENQMMVRHFQTEDYIMESGLNYTIFRNALYMDVLPLYLGENTLTTGINLPAGDGKVAFALKSDMGEGIANVLLNSDCNNEILSFTGSEAYSFQDVAQAFTDLSGTQVDYTALDEAGYDAAMKERRMPQMMAKFLLTFLIDIKNGQEDIITSDLEESLGRKPKGLKEGIKELFKL